MRILLVSSQDYIHHPIPSRHHYVFEELAKRGHEVHVAHFHVSNPVPPLRTTGLIVEEATLIPIKDPLLHYVLNAPWHFNKMYKIVEDADIDVVVTAHVLAGTASITAAKLHHIPVVFDLKDWFPTSAAAYMPNQVLKKLVKSSVYHVLMWNLTHSDHVITVSPSLVKGAKAMSVDAELIMNGVDTRIFKLQDQDVIDRWRSQLGYRKDDYVIGFVGSVERWYDIGLLIESLRLLPENVHLLIVGGGLFTNYYNEMVELAKRCGVWHRVTFAGLQPYALLPDYISCMNVCTIPLGPLHWRNIALPNKFFEYSAMGKAILMTRIPDVLALRPENVLVYEGVDEFVQLVKALIWYPFKNPISFEQHSWSNRADQFERRLQCLID